LDALYCLRHILGTEAAGEENWNLDFAADPATNFPIVNATRASEFLYVKRGVARVEEQRVYKSFETLRFFQRVLTENMNDLDQLYVWDRLSRCNSEGVTESTSWSVEVPQTEC
jgi:hypothetical protein